MSNHSKHFLMASSDFAKSILVIVLVLVALLITPHAIAYDCNELSGSYSSSIFYGPCTIHCPWGDIYLENVLKQVERQEYRCSEETSYCGVECYTLVRQGWERITCLCPIPIGCWGETETNLGEPVECPVCPLT